MRISSDRLFAAYGRSSLTRRQLLQALGLAATPAVLSSLVPSTSFAQGQCGGAKKGTPECDTTPAKLPFAPTGWKTVLLDHLTCQAADYAKEAAFYSALMNWPVRSDDGKQAMLDIGDWGGLLIRGGYVAPPAPAPDPAPGRPARAPRLAAFDGFCWGIEPWDTKTVEAALKQRGLNPVADHRGAFQSFRVKDPGGFDLQISNGNRRNRRQGAATGTVSAPEPFAHTNWRTVWLDHISYEAPNYKETAAFYHALLGWTLGDDEGSQNSCDIGELGGIIIRRGNRPPGATARGASIGHISFGITPFDPDAVKAELEKRGLIAREDTGGRGDIHTAPYKSYHTTTPNGYDLQISATTSKDPA